MSEKEINADNPGLPLPPPVLLGLALVVAVALEWLDPLRFLDPPFGWQFWAGVGLTALAAGLTFWGAREFSRRGTHVNPSLPAKLIVDSGPFRFVRNPMYSGFVLLLAGLSLAIGLEWGLLLAPLLWLSLHFLIVKREERYLSAKFGTVYDDYRRRVRRWGVF
ncbi:MAG: isoprenylcysteine carboxylmethyltransferase family protein [Cucumibacter sp.]